MSIQHLLNVDDPYSDLFNIGCNRLVANEDVTAETINCTDLNVDNINITNFNTVNINSTGTSTLNIVNASGLVSVNNINSSGLAALTNLTTSGIANLNSLSIRSLNPFQQTYSATFPLITGGASFNYPNPILSFFYYGSTNALSMITAIVAFNNYGNNFCNFQFFDITNFADPYSPAPPAISTLGTSSVSNQFTFASCTITANPTTPSVIGLYATATGLQDTRFFGATIIMG